MTDEHERRELEAAVTTAMLRVFDKVQRHRRLDRDYGTGDRLTMVEAEVCLVIASTRGISPSALADRIGVSRSRVSQALNRMRARGLVSVDHPADNAKARIVRVTDAGAMVANGVDELHRRMSRAVYAEHPHELEAFLDLFNRLDAFFAKVIAETTITGSDPTEQ